MKRNNDIILIGHLQVLDEALSSLYSDCKKKQFFLFVRVYEDNDDNSFVLTQVQPAVVLDYIDGKVGLKQIFSHSSSYYYKHDDRKGLCREEFVPIGREEADRKLQEDGLDDTFNMALAYNSMGIKKYLRDLITKNNLRDVVSMNYPRDVITTPIGVLQADEKSASR